MVEQHNGDFRFQVSVFTFQSKGTCMTKTDVLIIGGGISGVAIARELSRYEVDAILVEREADVGWGQSKAGYAIRHPGVRWPPGSIAQQMIVQGNRLMDQLIKDLDNPHPARQPLL